jgi:hypothetical protein
LCFGEAVPGFASFFAVLTCPFAWGIVRETLPHASPRSKQAINETMASRQLFLEDEEVEPPASSVLKTKKTAGEDEPPPSVNHTEQREEGGAAAERRHREEAESLELARRLMAEEAMNSYHQHVQLLRESADQLSQEDYNALQSALEEEEHEQVAALENEDGALSYETMLELGERIGDVKTERWAMIAEQEINKLPVFPFDPCSLSASEEQDADDSERKCLVCQCEYEKDEHLRRLPCNHCFHTDCVDQWLSSKEVCPYCRQSVREI